MKRICRHWTPNEVQFLRETAAIGITCAQLVPFYDRTREAIRCKRQAMGIRFVRKVKKVEEKPVYLGPPVSAIKETVARHFNVPAALISSPDRHRKIARPRQVAMYLARTVTRKSYPHIGQLFCRDHSTVIHGVRQVQRRMVEDHNFKNEVTTLRSQLVSKEQEENATYQQQKRQNPHFDTFMLSPASA